MSNVLTEKELKKGYLVLHIKSVEEGVSSNYARYDLVNLLYFKNENQRKGYMEEADMYGNDEFDSGNSYEEVTLEDVYEVLDVTDYSELVRKVGTFFKLVDKAGTDYTR